MIQTFATTYPSVSRAYFQARGERAPLLRGPREIAVPWMKRAVAGLTWMAVTLSFVSIVVTIVALPGLF